MIVLLAYHVVEEILEFRHIWRKLVTTRKNLESQLSSVTKAGQVIESINGNNTF